jgi:glutamine synthetase
LTEFSFGVGNRAASFRIPTSTAAANGKGYVEDRRPASNIDPYIVAAMLFDTGVLPESKAAPLQESFKRWKEWRDLEHIPY